MFCRFASLSMESIKAINTIHCYVLYKSAIESDLKINK